MIFGFLSLFEQIKMELFDYYLFFKSERNLNDYKNLLTSDLHINERLKVTD